MVKTINTDHYTYSVAWSEIDGEYVGLCKEFPTLSWLDKNPDKAFKGIRNIVAEAIEDMRNENFPIPEPQGVNIK